METTRTCHFFASWVPNTPSDKYDDDKGWSFIELQHASIPADYVFGNEFL
jgi:hypothetical protein